MRNHTILFLVIIVLVAYALRLYHLDAVPLRGDEAYTAIHWTQTPFSSPWLALIEYEPNPGSLVLYWAWSVVTGSSEFALRYLSLLMNIGGLGVMVALAYRTQRNTRLALLVGVLWAVNPFFIWHAQDARQYGPLTLLTVLNMLLFLRAIERGRRGDWLIYVLLQTVTVYVYYIELFWVAAQGIYALSLRRGDRLRQAIMAWALMGVLLIPLAAQTYVVTFVRGYEGTATSAALGDLFSDFVPTLLFGENTWPVLAGGVVFGGLLLGVWTFARRRVFLLAWMIVPVLLLTVASTQAALFLPRYVIAVTPVLLLALVVTVEAVAVRLGERMPARRTLAGGVIGVLVMISLVEVGDYFLSDTPKAADWRGLTGYLDDRLGADDLLISDSIDPALEYYGDADRVLFIPEDDPAPSRYVPAALVEHQAIYLLAGARTGDVGQYLQVNAQAIPGDDWPGVTQFRPWTVNPREIAVPLELRFGEVAVLRGYTLLGDETLLLYWEALTQTTTDHSALLHIEATPDAPPVATLDHAIAGALVSTRTWTPGTLYRDPVALPDLPAGAYTLLAGLYPTGTPDLLRDPDRDDDDGRYPIGVLSVES